MQCNKLPVCLVAFLVTPTGVFAQTAEIQQEVETKLWIYRVLARIEEVMGMPSFVLILAVLALLVALLAFVWLWRMRQKDETR